jgi:hypothetical protein
LQPDTPIFRRCNGVPLFCQTGRKDLSVKGVIIDDEKAMVVMGVSDEAPTALFSESTGFLRFFSQIFMLSLIERVLRKKSGAKWRIGGKQSKP